MYKKEEIKTSEVHDTIKNEDMSKNKRKLLEIKNVLLEYNLYVKIYIHGECWNIFTITLHNPSVYSYLVYRIRASNIKCGADCKSKLMKNRYCMTCVKRQRLYSSANFWHGVCGHTVTATYSGFSWEMVNSKFLCKI